MTEWVNWANRTGSLLLVDTAYAAFLSGEELPRSIYAVPGAKRCAIEVGSFSKSDGFTGVRCGWVILPRETGCAAAWQRWLGSHSNGTSYPIQRAAEAALSPTGLRQRQRALALYRQNAATMLQMFHKLGLTCAARRPAAWPPTSGSAVRMARMPKTAGPGSTACWRAAVFSAPRGPALGRWARAGCGLPPSPDRRTPPRLCGGWNTFCGRPALYYAR